MTEADWVRCGDGESFSADWVALAALGDRVSPRKLRLFACACARRVWAVIVHDAHKGMVATAEWFADGETSDAEREAAFQSPTLIGNGAVACRDCLRGGYNVQRAREGAHAAAVTSTVPYPRGEQMVHQRREKGHQRDLLRDVFGDLFNPIAFDAAWRTDTAVSLARHMYESRDFSAMPVLGDALQDAGCDSADVLEHCRGPGPHVRGCWVVDLVLGKV